MTHSSVPDPGAGVQWTPSSREPLASQIFTVRSLPKHTHTHTHTHTHNHVLKCRRVSVEMTVLQVTHSEAVNSWLPFVARPLMGLSCPRTSPRGASESACQKRSSPLLQPPRSTGEPDHWPGITARALTQSAWALTDCEEKKTAS